MNDNEYTLTVIRYCSITICTLIAILVVGYRFGEAQRVRLLSVAKDPVAAACALEQSSTNTICAVHIARIKE